MKIHEALADAYVQEHEGPLFALMGDANLTMCGALARRPGQVIVAARHEAGAVAMADGYFRATGRLGVAAVTCGPGLTQCATSLTAASRNRSAIVVLTGDTPPHWPITLQMFDQRRFVESCEAQYHVAASAPRFADDVAEAFYKARMHRRPVVLSVPLDLLEAEAPPTWTYRRSIERYASAGSVMPSEAAVDAVAAMLACAERPLVLAGRGATAPAAREAMIAIAERTGALLGTSLLARGLFSGETYDIGIVGGFAATAARRLLADVDGVLAVGAELGHLTTMGGDLFPRARIARIDIESTPWPVGLPPGLFVHGDAVLATRAIDASLAHLKVRKTGFHTASTRDALTAEVELPPRADDGADPRRLMLRLSHVLPDNAFVTVGLGHFWSFPAMYLDQPAPADMRFCHQFGAIGQTLPVAIGQAIGAPERPHLVIEGDASLLMNVQELETAARHRVRLSVLICNDSGMGAETHKLVRKGYDPSIAAFPTPDFVAIARAVGGDGLVIEHEHEIEAAMERAFSASGLFVVDARVSPSTLSDPYLRTHYGQEGDAPLPQGRLRGAARP